MREKVTLIGIAGDSGAGKSTYVAHLRQLLGEEKVTVVTADDYHSLDRAERNKIGVTALHPWKANNLGLLIDHLWKLKKGLPIEKPVYDHGTGTFGTPEWVEPKPIVLIEGLHLLYLDMLRKAFDLKIYFDTDIALRVKWKIRRDAQSRGYTEEEVLKEIGRRRPDVERYIEPQKAWADLVIHYMPGTGKEHAEENSEAPVRVLIAERVRGGKRRLVKWLALATRLNLMKAAHTRREFAGTEMEVVCIEENTEPVAMHSLLEMIRNSRFIASQLDQTHYDPVSLSRLLVAYMIEELVYGSAAGKEIVI